MEMNRISDALGPISFGSGPDMVRDETDVNPNTLKAFVRAPDRDGYDEPDGVQGFDVGGSVSDF